LGWAFVKTYLAGQLLSIDKEQKAFNSSVKCDGLNYGGWLDKGSMQGKEKNHNHGRYYMKKYTCLNETKLGQHLEMF
jgi:hypothetical protein